MQKILTYLVMSFENIQFTLDSVKPTAMFRCVMRLEPVKESAS